MKGSPSRHWPPRERSNERTSERTGERAPPVRPGPVRSSLSPVQPNGRFVRIIISLGTKQCLAQQNNAPARWAAVLRRPPPRSQPEPLARMQTGGFRGCSRTELDHLLAKKPPSLALSLSPSRPSPGSFGHSLSLSVAPSSSAEMCGAAARKRVSGRSQRNDLDVRVNRVAITRLASGHASRSE